MQEDFLRFLPEEEYGVSKNHDFPKDIQEELDYLDEALNEYERFIMNIGNLGVSAVMLMYYRDEVQESMDYLKTKDLDIAEYWKKIIQLDNILRSKTRIFVSEVGYNSFKQYQIINDPPKLRWWWYLDKGIPAPLAPGQIWEIWK